MDLRRRICLDVLPALRDAEGELGNWRTSPLRPLLEDAVNKIQEVDIQDVATKINDATEKMGGLQPIKELEDDLRSKILTLAGKSQDLRAKLGFTPTDPLRIFRSIRIFIDEGKRGIGDASLGSANLALLTLKLAGFEWLRLQNERSFTLVCIEEPEAHLHPHLQRSVFQKLFQENQDQPSSLFLTTHSPNIVSVTPLLSIVVLKSKTGESTKGYSLAELNLDAIEIEDLQRYLDVTRAEILFSKGVVFVEGDSEVALISVFANNIGFNLDEMGITVCGIGGTNFRPYVKFATALSLPFSVITDWDPKEGKNPLGWNRSISLMKDIRVVKGEAPLGNTQITQLESDEKHLRSKANEAGIFLNNDTLELEIARTPALVQPLIEVLEDEMFGVKRQGRISAWKNDPSTINVEQLMAMVADIGKGRLAGRIALKSVGLSPPDYIKSALEYLIKNV